MSTVYQSSNYNTNGFAQPAIDPGLDHVTINLHATCAVNAPVTGDTVYFGYLPKQAVVHGVTLKADGQLDSSGSPTLTYDVGIAGTTQLFMAVSALVGRASGPSYDTATAAGGKLWTNTTGADAAVFATVHNGAATGGAGTLELMIDYHMEPVAGLPV